MRIVPSNTRHAAARCNASVRCLPPVWLLSLGLVAGAAQAQEAAASVVETPPLPRLPLRRLQRRRPLQRPRRPTPLSRRRLPKYRLRTRRRRPLRPQRRRLWLHRLPPSSQPFRR